MNDTARLSLVKEVINNNGGTAVPANWTLNATPVGGPAGLPTVSQPGANLASAIVVPVRPGVRYNLSETGALPATTGYTNTAIECSIGAGAPVATSNLTLLPGESATCRFVNNDPIPHFVLAKSSAPADGATVTPGSTVTYTLTATNDGAGVLTGAVVTDNLSDVLDNATMGTIGAGGSLAGTTLTWAIPTLQPGTSATLVYTVTVNAGAFNATLRNVATPGPGGVCVLPANCDTVHPTPGYTLAKSSNPADGATVNPGSTVTYTLTATNNSAGVVSGAVVTDNLSDVLDNATMGTVGAGGSVTGTTLTWNVPTLQPGQVATLVYTVTVNAGAYNQNLGNVVTPGPGGVCVLPANCDTVHPTPGYTLAKSSNPADGATVNPGSTVTYTLTATNNSGGVLTGAVVTDNLSDVLDNATMGTVGAGGRPDRHDVDVDVPTLQPGTSATLAYTVTVNAGAYNQSLGNVVTPGPGGVCVLPANCDTVHPTPGYTLAKSSNPADGATVNPGESWSTR